MTEYIEKQAMLEDFESCNRSNPKWTPQRVKTLIVRQPPADAVPIIRCKDCLYSRGLDRNDPHDDRYADGRLWCRKLCEDVCPVNYCSEASRRE